MPDSISIPATTDEQTKLFEAAAKNDNDAILSLKASLEDEKLPDCEEWPDETIKFWTEGLEPLAVAFTDQPLTDNAAKLVRAMLNKALDSAALRKLYEQLARQQFKDYEDLDGLVEALGLNHEDVKLKHIADKWSVLEETTPHAFCYGRSLGLNEIIDINDACNEIKLKGIKKCSISLRSFLENAIVVRKDSPITPWLTKAKHPQKMAAPDMEALVRSCVVNAAPLPLNLTRALFVPKILSDTTLKNLTTIVETASNDNGEDISQRWDKSRDIKELSERLKSSSTFETGEDLDLENVREKLIYAASSKEHAGVLAYSIAIFEEHRDCFPEWLDETLQNLKAFKVVVNGVEEEDTAIFWKDTDLFAETSDKIPGKQTLPWFQATQSAMGSDYLVNNTMTLPCKLWGYTEKTLAKVNEKNLLHDKVLEKLQEGKVTADLLYWVWKSKDEDLRAFLTDTPLLFKTLLKEVKGSYLKAQRDLKRMLLSDETFQRHIMNEGTEEGIAGLVRSAKTMTLLDGSERQSLLVQIVRIYKEKALPLVEERKSTSKFTSLPRITSIRSLKLRQMELEDLINRQLPENRHAIEVARGFGDLSENSEFKYAKERQRFLGNRQAEYERSLTNIRGTDFRSVEINNLVLPGCTVILNTGKGHDEAFHILGLLDTLPEQNIISFESPLGKALIGHKTAEHIKLPNGKEAIIKEIKKLSPELLDWLSADPDPIQTEE